jgi:hypothetical protein
MKSTYQQPKPTHKFVDVEINVENLTLSNPKLDKNYSQNLQNLSRAQGLKSSDRLYEIEVFQNTEKEVGILKPR